MSSETSLASRRPARENLEEDHIVKVIERVPVTSGASQADVAQGQLVAKAVREGQGLRGEELRPRRTVERRRN